MAKRTKKSSFQRPENLAAFGAAIRKRREGLGLTLDVLAGMTGISKPYLSNIETARAPGSPSEEKLRAMAKALELPSEELLLAADWLRAPVSIRRALLAATAGGERGETAARRADGSINLDVMMGTAGGARGDAGGGATGEGRGAAEGAGLAGGTLGEAIVLRNVPLINRVAAGKAAEFTDLSYPAGVADQYVPVPDLPGAPVAQAFALRVMGDSMSPEYNDGDLVIVGPPLAGADPKDGEDCVVRLGEMDHFATTFKRIYFVRDGEGRATHVRLVPLNAAHRERRVGLEEVTGVYPLMYRMVRAGLKG